MTDNNDAPTQHKLTFEPPKKPGDPDYYDIMVQIHANDIMVQIHANKSMQDVFSSKRSGDRISALFARLARLAMEDERLRDILLDYCIVVTHGEKRLWPPKDVQRVKIMEA